MDTFVIATLVKKNAQLSKYAHLDYSDHDM